MQRTVATHIVGTRNVVDAAVAVEVERFVFISTDKAVRPSSVMGASKWTGEQIVLASAPDGARFCSVRFGNVLGSRGSVIPTFARQIAAGGPVTVTHPGHGAILPEKETYEAVQLVLQASVFVEGGEVFMLEMGEAVSIPRPRREDYPPLGLRRRLGDRDSLQGNPEGRSWWKSSKGSSRKARSRRRTRRSCASFRCRCLRTSSTSVFIG